MERAALPPPFAQALAGFQQSFPPADCSFDEALAHSQAAVLASKSLNVAPTYATHFRSGIRELIQTGMTSARCGRAMAPFRSRS